MKLLVIDGNSIINRSFYGIRLLTNKKGMYTNAVTGFFNIYMKLINSLSPDCVAVAFDLKAPTFRHKIYDGYKAGRKGMPDELAAQLPYVKNILRALNIPIIESEGWEADDIIGTLSHSADISGNTCVIATGDRDSFQLITDNVSVNLAANKEDIFYTPDKIREKYGVDPISMIDVKSLMGDSSDNIPGVSGIGEKTALDLIQKYHSVEYIYENLDTIELTKSVRTKLENGIEMCKLSKKLGTIVLDVPIDTDISHYKTAEADKEKLSEILSELEMFSMLKKLGLKPSANHSEPVAVTVKTEEFILPENQTDVILIDNILYYTDNKKTFKAENPAEFLKNNIPKRTFDCKSLYAFCLANGYELENVVFDTTLAAYLLNVNANEYSLSRLCGEYQTGWSDNPDDLGIILYRLNSKLFNDLNNENMLKILTDIEIPLARVLSNMEYDGIMLDKKGVDDFGKQLEIQIEQIQKEIYELAGKEFNISSPKQLGDVLFVDLMLPSGKKTKTGYSTNADVLENLMDKHPIVPLISKYRTLTKLNSTYVIGLLGVVSDDSRIHSTFKQTETRTGRISSAEPNIQNIPVRTDLGRNMRKFFRAKDGYLLVDADYSQIELRVLAHISNDETMKKAFINNEDIHAITASQVFNQPPAWVTPEMRRNAKAVNFGIVYGIGSFSLSKDINVSVSEADRYIKAYMNNYSGVAEYMAQTVEQAKRLGYTTTMLGRKRLVPELRATNKIVQKLGERIARNTPIQGTAADIIKIAMVKVFNRLSESKLDARLILQVHDELIVECKENEAEEISRILKEEMEAAVSLSVPLTVDVNYGKTWFDTH